MAADGLALLFQIRANADQAKREIAGLRSTISSETAQMKTGFGGAETSSASFGASIGSSALKVAGIGAAVVTAVAGLYSFALSATQAAADLKDLSDKTGFQVETLSALSNVAETTGGSIETVANALGIFEKNQAAAENGNQKMSATFRALNIDVHNNEQGLRDAFRALNSMGEGSQQVAAAMQLFGRSGKDVLAIIKDTNGDLDAAIKKFSDLGTLVSTKDARAADDFHDKMAAVGQQLSAVGKDIALGFIPVLEALAGTVGVVVMAFKGWGMYIEWVRQLLGGGQWMTTAIQGAINKVPGLDAIIGVVGATKMPGGGGPELPRAPGGGGGSKEDPRDAAHKARLAAIKHAEQTALNWIEYYTLQTEKQYAKREIDLAQYTDNLKAQAKARLDATWGALDEEERALQTSGRNQAEILQRTNEIKIEKDKAWRDYDRDSFKLGQDLVKERERLEKERLQLLERIADVEEDIRERRRSREDEELQRQRQFDGALFEASKRQERQKHEAERRALDLETQMGASRAHIIYERTRLDLEEEERRHRAIKDELDAQELSLKALASTEAQKLAIEKTYNALREQERERHEDVEKGITAGADQESRTGMFPEGLNPFGQAGTDEFVAGGDVIKATFADIKAVGMDAFSSLASGMGQMVAAWAQGANLGAGAMRKLVSSVLAGVAAQAMTQAVLFTAYGIAALTPWGAAVYGPASQWFAAAALMASIGGIAAIAGRAIAPRESTASTASAGSSASTTNTSSNPGPIDVGRRTSETTNQPLRVVVEVKPTEAFVVRAFTEDWQSNGKTRLTVVHDGA